MGKIFENEYQFYNDPPPHTHTLLGGCFFIGKSWGGGVSFYISGLLYQSLMGYFSKTKKCSTRNCLIIAPPLVKRREKIFPNFCFQKNIFQFFFVKQVFFLKKYFPKFFLHKKYFFPFVFPKSG
jgi:hypothetical protein